MKDLQSKIEKTFQELKVNKNFPEFLKRANYLENQLNKDESLVIKHESRDSPDRFDMGENIDVMNLYIKRKECKEERILSLDVTGILSYDEKLFESYNSSD